MLTILPVGDEPRPKGPDHGLATTWLRYLFLRLSAEELRAVHWRVHLGPALVVTWLAGMGRYWDHPSASCLQMFGIGWSCWWR